MMIEPKKTRREEYSDATRDALIAAGRVNFAEYGFAATSIEAVSRAARVTRGAFYHHFADKDALFDAVVVSMQAEAIQTIRRRVSGKGDLVDMLFEGLEVYLDVCLEAGYARIVVREAPSILGLDRFREIDETYPMALLMDNLKALRRAGLLDFGDIETLCRMIDAMVCKLALMLPTATDPKALRASGQAVIRRLLNLTKTA